MQRVLVIYASPHGSTHEIAEAIADELRASGLDAACVSAREVRALDCDAVVLGSAVRLGRWRRESQRVLAEHGEELAGLPFWVFSSGPVGDAGREEGAEPWLEPQHTIAEAVRLGARDHVVFGASLAAERPSQEQRDWDQIRSWARAIAVEVRAAEATASG